MKNLNLNELKTINGGNVPIAFYMDDDTIAQNGKNSATFGIIVYKTLGPFWKDILKFMLM
jgi:bacteriocin-like protein